MLWRGVQVGGNLMVAPVPVVVAGMVAAVVAAGAVVVLTRGGSGPAPAASPSPAASLATTPSALSSQDWGAVTIPRAACDPSAKGDVTLVHGRGRFGVGALNYVVSADPELAYGKLEGQQAAALQLTCLLEGANGVGGRPIAVFVGDGDGARMLGVVRNQDLGTAPRTSSALVPSSEKFVQGQLVIVGAYLQGADARCCPSGTGWTTIRWVGTLVPSGVIRAGLPPTTLPTSSTSLITYPGGVTVRMATDLPKLVGAPDDFKQFVLTQVPPAETPCNEPGRVIVKSIRSDGYAVGSAVYHCERAGHEVLWGLTDGAWKQVAASEDLFDCATLHAAHFPAALLGPDPHCTDRQGKFLVYDEGAASPSPTSGALPSGVQLIDYRDSNGNGLTVGSVADVDKLERAPEDFKAFIRSEYQKLTAGMSSAVLAQCHAQIDVEALRTDGFAVGGESACGGSAKLWAKVGGSWKTVLAIQDYPPCRDLRRLHFPPDVFDKGGLDQCLEGDGHNVTYAP